MKTKQQSFFTELKSKHKIAHGGELRKKRQGRLSRPLSTKHSHHIIFKINSQKLSNRSFRHPKNFALVKLLLNRYAKKFFVKIEMITFQHDHIHIVARSSQRSYFHHFFRVFSGQIAQNLKVTDTSTKRCSKEEADRQKLDQRRTECQLEKNSTVKLGLWKYRPYTVIVKAWRNYLILRDYLRLNEKEVTKQIPYRKQRLKGLSLGEMNQLLWS